MKKDIIKIIIPPTATTSIDLDLVKLTEYLTKKIFKGKRQGGGLAGEFGYGVDYENDVFMMHQFCWCEKDDCKWCGGEVIPSLIREIGNIQESKRRAPNFWHKKADYKIWWYKWIGRDMEFNKKISAKKWKEIYKDCIKSII